MIWFFLWLAVVAFSFDGMFIGYMRPESLTEWFFVGLFWLFLVSIAGVICGVIAFGIGTTFPTHRVNSEVWNLAALRDKDGVEGRFFLGSGQISSVDYFFFYKKVEDGGLQADRVVADSSAIVYEQDRADASVQVYDWVYRYPWWAFTVSMPSENAGHSYSFYVPKGSVRKGFSL